MSWATKIVIDKLKEGYGKPEQPLYWEDYNKDSMVILDINKQYLLYNIAEICEENGCKLLVDCLYQQNDKDTGWRYARLNIDAINILLKKENVDSFMELYKEGFYSPTKTPKKHFNEVRKEYISALKCAKHILTIAWFGRVFIVEG